MLFSFRGVRIFQVILALAAAVTGIGSAILLKVALDETKIAFIPATILGLTFIFVFSMALRLPTSFVAVSDERTRIRFPGFVDTVISNDTVTGARLVKHSFLGGLGVRTAFRGNVVIATAWGAAAELTLRQPIRVYLIPKIWRYTATSITVTVRNPHKLVDRFTPGWKADPSSPAVQPARKMRRRRSRAR